ncbi:hypothetical protein [Gottfriedia solisilvae]|uniref:hypothetical protein n=1 Tax=Gottfriedia solisilvae TaxID=1516104 RepID=UPI000B42FBF5|nr:hypothetical protein [Gottfriedia solisilvae]
MLFFIVSIVLWTSIIAVPVTIIWGIWKKSVIAFISSGIFASLLYIWICVFNELSHFFVIVPLFLFLIAYMIFRKSGNTKR